jgi:hypothetical protein
MMTMAKQVTSTTAEEMNSGRTFEEFLVDNNNCQVVIARRPCLPSAEMATTLNTHQQSKKHTLVVI